MIVCPQCGTESPVAFRFCPGCGAALADSPEPRQARKVVTALFCDVTGSTALGEELDPEVLRGVLNRYFAEMRSIIERHGGTVEKFIGDAVMAVFGIPTLHEDDALRAVRAAAEIRARLPAVAEEVGVTLRFRTGVNTGSVLTGEGENLAVGDAVNVAARLEQAAAPGEIVIGGETLALVRDAVSVEALEPLELKGKSEPVRAFRLLSVDPVAEGIARHLDTALVGRRRELELLGQAWDRAVRESGCHLFTLLGEAGVGKSRLVSELLGGIGATVTVLRGRCLHYGEGITFWPLVEALMPAGQAAEAVIDRLKSGGAAVPEELFWDVRRLLEGLAAQRPVVLHIDDLQWAEPMLLDLVDHVADLSRGAPILLLCTARPELLDVRPGWGGGKLNATTVLLEPLSGKDSEALLDELGDGLDPEARARVIAASEGNPLFLEEMVALARERGTVEVPPTIHALLTARLERLGVDEREVLERGAVEGEIFHRLALRALAGEQLGAEVEACLAGLVRKELIRPHPAILQGDEAFRFRHLLIRDAAYDSLPKGVRADLHERFARWLEAEVSDLVELNEIAGWHLEQAVRYRRELGQEVAAGLAAAAAAHLHSAGVQAGRRADTAAARNLLERALAMTVTSDPIHPLIAVDLAGELTRTGDHARVDEVLRAVEDRADAPPMARLLRLGSLLMTRPREAIPAIESDLPGLMERFEAERDERALAQAHMLGFMTHWLRSRAGPASRESRLAAEHAELAGDEGLRSHALGIYVSTIVYGPSSATVMAPEIDRVEAEGVGPYLQAFLAAGRAEVERLRDRLPEARIWAARTRERFAEIGSPLESFGWDVLAEIELSAGDLDAALAAMVRSDEMAQMGGSDAFRSTAQARIAQIQLELGNPGAAREAIELSDALSADEDVINFALTHRVRAMLALSKGEAQEAERWARSSVSYADQTDFPFVRAEARIGLARVLSAAGRRQEAETSLREALAMYEAKEDVTAIRKTRELLAAMIAT